MEKMKVAMYYRNNDVRIEEMPIPVISEDEILVKVILQASVDLMFLNGTALNSSQSFRGTKFQEK